MNISEHSCQGGSASSVFEKSGFQISARIRIFVCSGGCHDNNMIPRVSAARHKDAFREQLQSVALSVFTLCGSVSPSRSDCISPVTKKHGRVLRSQNRLDALSAKDVRVVHHSFIPRFLLSVVNC